MALKLHGVSLSPFVRKVQLALAYKQQDYEQINVFPGDESEEFAAISPLNKIPVLDDDGFTVADSSIILRYLERRFPDHAIYPEDPQDEARACWLEEYSDTRLVENCAGLFQERFLATKFFKREPDEARIQAILTETMPSTLDYLESVVADSGYFLGGQLTVADIAITSSFVTAGYGDFQPDADTHPKLAGYVSRAMAAPMVVERLEAEKQAAASMGLGD
jgi:glutathione S-transferase